MHSSVLVCPAEESTNHDEIKMLRNQIAGQFLQSFIRPESMVVHCLNGVSLKNTHSRPPAHA